MNQIKFTLTLTSDGEPASGFGTGLTNSLLPRDSQGRIVLPASHLKGIIRENLEKLPGDMIPRHAVSNLFGFSGSSNAEFHLNDAVAPKDTDTVTVTRTEINPFGVAKQTSLRTSEAVAGGTRFAGVLFPHAKLTTPYLDLLKLGLLSLFAVGGNRSRGAGACFVTIDNENRTPGDLLKSLAGEDFSQPIAEATDSQPRNISDHRVILGLTFNATGPVCVPEIPVVENNMIRSGFTIPASAIQGAVLHRINDISKSVADACFESSNFRAWPLSPSDDPDSFSLRTPITHKVGKIKNGKSDNCYFEDESISFPNPANPPANTFPTGTDGVLISNGSTVRLWKSTEMGRIITAHGVHNGDRDGTSPARNLFTVEALSPAVFIGVMAIPETACDLLLQSLEKDPYVRLGKAKSVRGGGKLSAQKIEFSGLPAMKSGQGHVFIVQSPVCVPANLLGASFNTIMETMAWSSGFGEIEASWGSMEIRFGWNRETVNGRLPPNTVITPGSVFRLKSPITDLEDKLLSGIGNGREYGFGAVLPHPGTASALVDIPTEPRIAPKPDKNFGVEGYDLWKKAIKSKLSTSQISRIRELVLINPVNALNFIERQRTDRPPPIWERWKPVYTQLMDNIQNDPNHTVKILKVCQDLLAAGRK